MSLTFIGMGANLGDRLASLAAALDELGAVEGITVVAASSVYESEPWGVADQPAFANAVALLETDLAPEQLLDACKRIEGEAGRVAGVRNGPRPLDLDILLFDDAKVDTDRLQVPHPRLLERDFVVTPLLELAPAATLPDGAPIDRSRISAGRVTGVLAPPLR